MNDNFTWRMGRPLPEIARHSDRKLRVIEQYIDVYFDTVAAQPHIDKLNITIVDAFCGGGLYTSGDTTRSGSPLAILDRVSEADSRLNLRRTKPLVINSTYHFSDERREHVEHLREVLRKSQHRERLGQNINLAVGSFESLLPSIIVDIKRRQKVGRSIFVLDQFGYTDVPMAAIQTIFNELQSAEVILTFSIDALLNYLPKDINEASPLVQQFGVDQNFLDAWQAHKDEDRRRMIAQRSLMALVHKFSNAAFFTPFMLYSEHDKRWMMIAHLSQNQAARDKMLGVHWQNQNSFKHLGRGSWFELGFDTRLLESETSLFNFTDADRSKLKSELENEIPWRLHELIKGGEMPVQAFLRSIGNHTAAMNKDVFSLLTSLSGDREIEVKSADGKPKRAGSLINLKDVLVAPQQRRFNFN